MVLQDVLAQVEAFFLVLVRLTSFMMTAPFFSIRNVPVLTKAGWGALLAVFLFPAVLPAVQGDQAWGTPLVYSLAVVNEALAGLALGYIANLLFTAVRVAGEILDLNMGLAMANLLDPQNAAPSTLLGQFFALLGLFLFLALDGHHALLLALRESFRLLPLGGVPFTEELVENVVGLWSSMFLWALRLVLPVLVVLVVADISLSLVARTVPQLNVFILSFPLKVGLGLLTLIVFLPLLATAVGNLVAQMERDLALILKEWPR
ncbi:flagellar biosynthetic protein FliR [Thermanaeromonas sp. C210]|uniref:flagellar biosynthetic protein FliR n=1 Tax=Thermanaeromonas sp. C210 TaxID=2731925 RepID=UPI00155C9E3E|nr:flagellar biosynthetic protein FliR [Thermanaeromonas sp. C210]GFN24135.1 flagellar biosynthetic protein FliR [Thermanaeromonas sp. C210]